MIHTHETKDSLTVVELSVCRQYRFSYHVQFKEDINRYRPLLWVMLNPSTADHTKTDATIRRVIDFTKRYGYNHFYVLNLLPVRSSNPKEAARAVIPEDVMEHHWQTVREHLKYIRNARQNPEAVLAWGVNAAGAPFIRPMEQMLNYLDDYQFAKRVLMKPGLRSAVTPNHPLYLPKDSKMVAFP